MLGISGTLKHLIKYTAVNKYLFIAELVGANKEIRPKMVNNFIQIFIKRIIFCKNIIFQTCIM